MQQCFQITVTGSQMRRTFFPSNNSWRLADTPSSVRVRSSTFWVNVATRSTEIDTSYAQTKMWHFLDQHFYYSA